MRHEKRFSIVLLLSIMLFQGCASSDKRLAMNQLQKIDSVKVIRHETPKLMKATSGSRAAAMTGIMFGAIGGAIGGAISATAEAKAGRAVTERCKLPDFGELVLNKFVESLPKEMAGWPRMELEKNPVAENVIGKSGYILILNVGNIRMVNGIGLSTTTTAQMIDSNKNVLWQKTMWYTSEKFNRCKTLDKLEADDGKLLREEFDYAAEKTASDFIAHLKGSGDEVAKSGERSASKQENNTEPGLYRESKLK